MDEKKKDGLDEVMQQDKQRGRRPIDYEARRKRAQLAKDMRKLLEAGSEEDLVKVMRAAGLRRKQRPGEN